MPKVNRLLSSVSPTLDGGTSDFRVGRYGDLYVNAVYDGVMAAADEGSYFIAVNPTSGTGIATSVATAYSATASAVLAVQNRDSQSDAGTAKRIYLDYIKLIVTVAPASGTAAHFDLDLDTVLTRFTSGGSALTPANVNTGASQASVASVNFGALTTVAVSSAGRACGRIRVRTAIPVVGDTYVITFGGIDKPTGGGVINGTNPQLLTYNVPPIVLTPGATFTLSAWYPSNAITPASYEVELGWIER